MSDGVHERIRGPTIAPSLATPSEPLSASTVWGMSYKTSVLVKIPMITYHVILWEERQGLIVAILQYVL